MATPTSSAVGSDDLGLKNRSWLDAIFASPVLWGAGLTAVFYAAIPHLPLHREFVLRYCTGHPLAYVEMTLFFLGITILTLKFLSVGKQRRALHLPLLDQSPVSGDAEKTATHVLMRAVELPRRLHDTFLVRRTAEICKYVRGHGNADNLYEHQKFLADVAADRLHESYGLLRTITWAIPILGFLGTVMGITIAISNVAINETGKLADSINEVTGGLGVAFDTTALALGLTLVVVFLSHWVEKAEQSVLYEVDEIAFDRIGGWFPTAEQSSPLMQAEQQAADHLLAQTEQLVSQQVALWQANVEDLRSRWMQTLQSQQATLAESLTAGATHTLDDHAAQLAAAREEMLAGYRNITHEIAGMMSAHRETAAEQQQAAAELIDQQRHMLFSEVSAMREELQAQADQVAGAISAAAAQWNGELSAASQTLIAHLEQLKQQGTLLSRIVEQEENLVRLQGSLNENLNAVRSVEAFDETLHNLSAAVHLLTVRTKAA